MTTLPPVTTWHPLLRPGRRRSPAVALVMSAAAGTVLVAASPYDVNPCLTTRSPVGPRQRLRLALHVEPNARSGTAGRRCVYERMSCGTTVWRKAAASSCSTADRMTGRAADRP